MPFDEMGFSDCRLIATIASAEDIGPIRGDYSEFSESSTGGDDVLWLAA